MFTVSFCITARILLFARLRATALPSDRDALTATRVRSILFGKAINTISGWANEFPKRLTRLKSVAFVSRKLRFTIVFNAGHDCSKLSSLPLGVLTIPVYFLYMLIFCYCQPVASFKPAVFEDFTPSFSGHSGTESMHPCATADFWLVCSFWHDIEPSENTLLLYLENWARIRACIQWFWQTRIIPEGVTLVKLAGNREIVE